MSPKKMRRVAALVKGKPVEEALNILNYTPKAAAHPLAKTVKSAAANAIAAVGSAKLRAEDLSISRILVDEAPTAKRIRFQSMGRVFRIRKRFCHLMVEVEGEPIPEEPKSRGRRRKKVKDAETEPAAPSKKTAAKAKKAAKPRAKAKDEEVETTEDKLTEPEVEEQAATETEPETNQESETDSAGDNDKKEE
jgi:large subunit ribosomal protein L22